MISTFVLILLAVNTFSSKISVEEVNRNENLVKCLQSMLHSDNEGTIKYVRISIESESKQDSWIFGEMVNQLRAAINFYLVFEMLNRNDEKNKAFTIHRKIMFVSSFRSFERQIHLQRSYASDVSGIFQYFYVILPSNISNLRNVLQRITQFCLEHMIANLNILVENINKVVTIYSYYPFTSKSCRNSKPHIHNYFINGTFTWMKPVFPRKFTNLWKCTLKVILWDEPPFVQNISHPGHLFGVDISMLDYLASNMNFTWKAVPSPHGPGVVYSNGTFTNGFKMLNDRLGDLMLSGSSFDPIRVSKFAATRIYCYTIIKLILKPSNTYSSLLILLSPFDKYTWLAILGALIAYWILQALCRKFSTKFNINTRIPSKLPTVLLFLGILVFRSSYEGLVYRFILHNPYDKLPQSLDEAKDAGYSFLISIGMYNLFGYNFREIEKQTNILNVNFSVEMLREFHKIDGKIGLIGTSSLIAAYRSEISPYREEYLKWIITDSTILSNYVCIYMPRFSFLTSILNNRISQMTSNGFRYRIYVKLIKSVLDKNRVLQTNNRPVPMSMEHFSGLFRLFSGMMVLGVFVCLLEIVSMRNTKFKLILSFFHRG